MAAIMTVDAEHSERFGKLSRQMREDADQVLPVRRIESVQAAADFGAAARRLRASATVSREIVIVDRTSVTAVPVVAAPIALVASPVDSRRLKSEWRRP